MDKSTHTPHYVRLRETLVALRERAGLSQRDLAAKLGRERSFVGRYELGERRLDLIELHWVLRALGQEPARVVAALLRKFEALEVDEKPSKKRRR